MTDANKYYLDKREAEQEEYDFKDEYEDIAADNVRLEAEVKKYHDAWLEAEAQVVDLEVQVEGCLAVIATERDEVLALQEVTVELEQAESDNILLIVRIEELEAKLAKAVGFIKNFALRAMIEEHDEDERDMIDFDSLRFERDCDIVQARTTLAELKGETDAE